MFVNFHGVSAPTVTYFSYKSVVTYCGVLTWGGFSTQLDRSMPGIHTGWRQIHTEI
jgi:hypothetical protein